MTALTERARGPGLVLALVVIAFGGAGLANVLDHPPTDAKRPELFVRGDAALAERWPTMERPLDEVGAVLEALSTAARDLLAAVTRRDPEDAASAVARGDETVGRLAPAVDRLRTAADEALADVERSRVGAANRARLAALDRALAELPAIPGAWASLDDRVLLTDSTGSAIIGFLDPLERVRGLVGEAAGR